MIQPERHIIQAARLLAGNKANDIKKENDNGTMGAAVFIWYCRTEGAGPTNVQRGMSRLITNHKIGINSFPSGPESPSRRAETSVRQ